MEYPTESEANDDDVHFYCRDHHDVTVYEDDLRRALRTGAHEVYAAIARG